MALYTLAKKRAVSPRAYQSRKQRSTCEKGAQTKRNEPVDSVVEA